MATFGAPAPGTQGCRVLFLGNEYNPLSVAVLRALATGMPRGSVTAGIHDPAANRLFRVILRSLRQDGLRFVVRKGLLFARSQLRRVRRRTDAPDAAGAATLSETCAALGVPSLTCRSPNDPGFVKTVRDLDVDLIVVAAFSRILGPTILAVPPRGCINVHPSLLPTYRGPNPYYWVLANGERRTGVSVCYMDEGIDSGDIVTQATLGITAGETESSLQSRSAAVAAELIRRVLPAVLAGTAPRIPQRAEQASYFPAPPRGRSSL
jgi:folate-dependent phosphoribosylglycinamide formyltransferase PurN